MNKNVIYAYQYLSNTETKTIDNQLTIETSDEYIKKKLALYSMKDMKCLFSNNSSRFFLVGNFWICVMNLCSEDIRGISL